MTITAGTNRLVGTDPAAILDAYRKARTTGHIATPAPEKWDGNAGQRIVNILRNWTRATP